MSTAERNLVLGVTLSVIAIALSSFSIGWGMRGREMISHGPIVGWRFAHASAELAVEFECIPHLQGSAPRKVMPWVVAWTQATDEHGVQIERLGAPCYWYVYDLWEEPKP